MPKPDIEDLRRRLEAWRAWAQFVYLGGGPISEPDTIHGDDQLRARVCAAHDKAMLDR